MPDINPIASKWNASVESRLSALMLRVAFNVHRELGPGLLPNAYLTCLGDQLHKLGLTVDLYKEMPVIFEDMTIDAGFVVPMLIERKIVVCISTQPFNELDMARMRTYLKFSQCGLGLLFNFNVTSLKDGVRRVLHDRYQIKPSGTARCLDIC